MAPRPQKMGKRKDKAGGADDNAEAAGGGPPSAKAIRVDGAAREAVRAPEAAEVLEIARTQNLFKSNLFRMQLEELLREAAPRASYPRLEAYLRRLQPVLLALKARELPPNFAEEFPDLRFRLRNPHPFGFKAPARVDVVGSFLLGTRLRSQPCVDLALEMPREAFASKDYLNYRYADKRAAYVGEVLRQLAGLRDAGTADGLLADTRVEVSCIHGDPYRPCAVLRLGAGAGVESGAWAIRLLPVVPQDLWPVSRLAPGRNAVRPEGSDGSAAGLPPTPCYNAGVLEDALMRSHLAQLHEAVQRTPALKEATLLLKRWARARQLLFAADPGSSASTCTPLNGFCLAMLAAHASLAGSVASGQTSPFQIFKLALNVLSNTDWATQKLIFGKASTAALSEEERSLCGAHFYCGEDPVNLFFRLGPFMEELRYEAKRALRLLDSTADPFEAVFGDCASPELVWDVLVRTPPLGVAALGAELASSEMKDSAAGAGVTSAAADFPKALSTAARLRELLNLGLADRCTRSGVRLAFSGNANGGSGPSVLVGLQLDASGLERYVDRGPAAQESAEAARFRELWGKDKAELRRFKDGSILECVVWQKPPADREVESKKHPAVVTQIVRHLVKRHFPELVEGADVVAGPLGFVPNLSDVDRRLWLTFETFRTHLCQLSSLPLAIKDVHPESAAFSYSHVDPPTAPITGDGIARSLHSVVVEFESSGRWPDHPQAARKVCAALYLQMKEELEKDLGIESGVTEDYLDVRYPEFVFRLRVLHQHELANAAHRVTNFQAQHTSPLPEPDMMERLRILWWRPRVRGALHGHVLQQPALAGAIRLVKRWFASQMLSGYDDFAEHLAAFVFLSPLPFDVPTSPQSAFCRVCWLLGTFDWDREPLVVDFDGKLSEEDRLAIRGSFEAGRGDGCFWIASRFDPHALLLDVPPATIGLWLRGRARWALAAFQRRALLAGPAGGWSELFSLDPAAFDVVLRLSPAKSGAAGAAAQRRAVAARAASEHLVDKLTAQLSSVCLVFHDDLNHFVALKWRPGAFLPQSQHVLMGGVPHSIVEDGKSPPLFVPNVLCICSQIHALAEGLAVSVSFVSH